MKKVILSVMMVFALGTVASYAQAPAKGCGGCKSECTAQQKAQCHGTEAKKDKKECSKKEECDKATKKCDGTKKEAKKEAQKPACCKKDAAKK